MDLLGFERLRDSDGIMSPVNTDIPESSTCCFTPITMNSKWSGVWRMILMIGVANIVTIISSFFVASFFVNRKLRKRHFVYLGSTGVADLIIGLVLCIAAAVLISQSGEREPMCHLLQFLTQTAVYYYNLSYMMTAIETYYRVCKPPCDRKRFLAVSPGLLSVTIFIICFGASATGVYLEMDYDYCTRKHPGNYTFRLVTAVFFQAIPFTATVLLLAFASLTSRHRALHSTRHAEAMVNRLILGFTNLNISCYLFYVFAWVPYMVVVNFFPTADSSIFYSFVWIGLARSIFTGGLFAAFNCDFNDAFTYLCNYCCFKKTPTTSYQNQVQRSDMLDCYSYKRGEVKATMIRNTWNYAHDHSSCSEV